MSRIASCLTLAFSLLAGSAAAGPNGGGTIIAVDAGLRCTVDLSTYCGAGTAPTSCADADVELDGTFNNGGHPNISIWKVYAAFPDGSSPRLRSMTFGIHYPQAWPDPNGLYIVAHGNCLGDPNLGAVENMVAVPNPGAGQVLILYSVPKAAVVTLEIYDVSGAEVRRLAEGPRVAGVHATHWDGRNGIGERLPAGAYFTRIETPAGIVTGRIILSR